MKTFKFLIRSAIAITMLLLLVSFLTGPVEALTPVSPFEAAVAPTAEIAADAGGVHKATDLLATHDSAGELQSHSLIGNLVTLGLLVLLQAVLGFDNLLYISLESKHAPPEKRASVRAWGIGIAIFLRIALLCILVYLRELFETTSVCAFDFDLMKANFNLHSVIVLVGGAFIIYTAMKEIWHMTRLEHDDHGGGEEKKKSVGMIIFWIVLMNVVFSFDSILSAMALTNVFWVMALAIVISGVAMVYLADQVATFLEKNRMYEVLGLFILFIVGIMLISEGGHLAHFSLFGNPVMPMTKTTFYFVLGVLVLTDIVQGRYQKKLLADKAHA
jgi:predicted tellurium resistance membrane protein TerC